MTVVTNISANWKTREGFESVFNEHYSRMCAYAYNFLKEQEASEEIVQEVFYQLWINREKTEIKTALQSYLYRSVRNRCINLIKHLEIRDNYKQYNQEQIEKADSESTDTLMVSELDNKIRACIDAMPLQRRKIFIMSRYESLTYKEIADKMGLSKKTIENQMGKALQYLKTELKEYLPLLLIFFSHLLNGK